MEKNLFEFDKKREEIVQEIIDSRVMIENSVFLKASESHLDPTIMDGILRFILEVMFKSTNYKLPEAALPAEGLE